MAAQPASNQSTIIVDSPEGDETVDSNSSLDLSNQNKPIPGMATQQFDAHDQAKQQGVFSGATSRSNINFYLVPGEKVEEWDGIIKSILNTDSSEADIYLAEKQGTQYALKYYREGIRINHSLVEKLLEIKHDNLASVLAKGYHKKRYFEVLPYVKEGALSSRLKNGEKKFLPMSEEKATILLKDMNDAIHTLHQHNIIHRDIKPSNILVDNFEEDKYVLADYGISSLTVSDSDETDHSTTVSRTEGYAAPEIYSGLIRAKVDYYSLGITAYVLVTGINPFRSMSPQHIISVTLQGAMIDELLKKKEASQISGRYKNLMRGLLLTNAKNRWGFNEINLWLDGQDVVVEAQSAHKIPPLKFGQHEFTALSALAAELYRNKHDRIWHKLVYEGELEAWAKLFDLRFNLEIKEVGNKYKESEDAFLGLAHLAYRLDPGIPFQFGNGLECKDMQEIADLLMQQAEIVEPYLENKDNEFWLWVDCHDPKGNLVQQSKDWLVASKDRTTKLRGIRILFEGVDLLRINSDLSISRLSDLKNEKLTKDQQEALKLKLAKENSSLFIWGELSTINAREKELLNFWKIFKLGKPVQDFLDLIDNFGVIEHTNWHYTGPTKILDLMRVPHGFGSAIKITDGREYIGEWQNGKRYGTGTTEWKDGRKYAGQYRDDYEEGKGKLTWSKGRAVFDGTFKKGYPDGEGSLIDEKRNKYLGEFQKGKKHGKGKIQYADGGVYEGQWVEDLPQGSGEYTSKSHDNYQGFWQKGRYHGRGILKNSKKGLHYFGDFSMGKKHGPGVLKLRDGSWEQGMWQNDSLFSGTKVLYSKGQPGYRVQILQDGKKQQNYRVSQTSRISGASKNIGLAILWLFATQLGLLVLLQFGIVLNFLTIAAIFLTLLMFPIYSFIENTVSAFKVLSGLGTDKKGDKILDWTQMMPHIAEPSWKKIFPNG